MERLASPELPLLCRQIVSERKPTQLLGGGDISTWGWDSPNTSETDGFVLLSRCGNGHTHGPTASPGSLCPHHRYQTHCQGRALKPSIPPPAPKHPLKAQGRGRPLLPPRTLRPACATAGKRCEDRERAAYFLFYRDPYFSWATKLKELNI